MNIVEKYTKIDLHIHSSKSEDKDGSLVSEGTLANISKDLVPKLEDEKVNMVAITDHNAFSYQHYIELRKYSNIGGHLLKVLPGIELDIEIEDSNKDTHAIAIFDDQHEEKTKEIELIVEEKKKAIMRTSKVSKSEILFKPADAIDLFRKIGLHFVLIVHQKADPCNDKINQEHNASDLGIDKYNELVSYDYFDAVEFRSYKVEGFLVAHSHKYGKEYNSLCGSDCHEWKYYPKHDKNDKNEFHHCYINALPTFKGLVMALTGDNRIHFSNFEIRKPYLESIDFSLGGNNYSINLSSGLNVLIGDNSIGKSFLLEMLNNPYLNKDLVADSTFSKKLVGYRAFKKKLCFEILSKTLENDTQNVDFHRQGHIRSLFEGDSKSIEDQPFLSKYFVGIDTSIQEANVKKVINDFVAYEKIISDYQKQNAKVQNVTFILKPELNTKTFNLDPLVDKNTLNTKDYKAIINGLVFSKEKLDDLLKEPLLEKEDADKIAKIVVLHKNLIKKYEQKQKAERFRDIIYAIVVEKVNLKKAEIATKSVEIDKMISAYKKEKAEFSELISDFVIISDKNNKKTLSIPEKIVTEDVEKLYDKYRFISRVKKSVVTKNDIYEMLISPINNTKDFSKILNLGFDNISVKLNAETNKLPFGTSSEKYVQACVEYSKTNWFQKEKGAIINKDKSKISGNSAGLNAQYYLDLYTLLEGKKLFIIDQPEDDVSEARISRELKDIMRRMAEREQILFVTHNAELVVNLDVDNVVVFKNDEDDNLTIANGALEYEDDKINILNEVAELLDGGAEVIRKRWKRYDKNNYKNND